MAGHSVLLEELAFAADSYFIDDQLCVLFNREVLEADHAVTELERHCAQQVERIRQRKDYIRDLRKVRGFRAANGVLYMRQIVDEEEDKLDQLNMMLVDARRALQRRRRYVTMVYLQ
ncbi:hypothetical protein CTI12_AA457070 [Artemisia annua]|uniref:Uncharacterized protein n=1 Tax=Artemisia annua TaxID=35608 RepID=A0A2U1LT90_ARTAN|nr:hypothetical protein CTI12_AA457070 [Artemisia annua]